MYIKGIIRHRKVKVKQCWLKQFSTHLNENLPDFLETEVSLLLQQALVTVSILFMPERKKECITL